MGQVFDKQTITNRLLTVLHLAQEGRSAAVVLELLQWLQELREDTSSYAEE